MLLSDKYELIDPKLIRIPPERQRQGTPDLKALVQSIKQRGVYNPIIVQGDLTLVAGWCRTHAAIEAGVLVPIRFAQDLTPMELRIVELEENTRRSDLPWQDEVRAIARLHVLYEAKATEEGASWSKAKTAEMLFYDHSHIIHVLRVHQDLASPRLAAAPGLRAAYNILARLDERKIGDAMESISRAGQGVVQPKPPAAPAQPPKPGDPPAPPALPPVTKPPGRPSDVETILNLDFSSWASTYTDDRFNFVHCDFPYGVNLFDGPQGGRDKWLGYDDDPNVYWKLIKAFCAERDNFMSTSAHMMFWFSIDFYAETLDLFSKLAPEIVFNPKPLIWHKSDNVGVLANPKRGPRHIYEVAFMASRGDRFIVQATSDLYAAPTDKAHHPSTKPEPMLKYFFRMFVDEHTRMLDPTCGSGAALRAAEALGAQSVLGLEIDKEHCDNARSALRQARAKAAASAASGRKP